jgi:tRNA(His) 5'-end guanylyltransferase
MSSIDFDTLGDRMKSYEHQPQPRIVMKGTPIVVRLDGKAFHSFCRGLEKPYDKHLCDLMDATMLDLVDWSGCRFGYTQSDEISLAFYLPFDSGSQYPFGGKVQKLTSLLAAQATVFFNSKLAQFLPQKADRTPALFDCRVFVVPDVMEVYNAFLWRQNDATKNAVAMAAQSVYSQKQLQNKNQKEQQAMLLEKGINFNDYDPRFKRGVFARRVVCERFLTEEELSRMAPEHRPTGPVLRGEIQLFDLWLSKVEDKVGSLFPDLVPKLVEAA